MIKIDELHIRVPGVTEGAGARLGMEVAERIATSMPQDLEHRHVPEMVIRLSEPMAADMSLNADRIAAQIIREINLSTLKS